jgi:phosphate transport system substrate-binding protein
MTRNLYVAFKQDQGRSQQAGQAYANLLLSDQGQKLLQEAGFVPLR